MDYSTINRNKKMEEIQNKVSDGLQDPKQNISTNPVIRQDTQEPQRDAYDLNKFAKTDGHFYQHPPPNLYPLPYEKLPHNKPRDPKPQVIDLTTTTYVEAANFTKQLNDNLDIPCKKTRNATATEVTVAIDDDISILIPDENIVQNLKLEKQKNLEEYSNMPTTSTIVDRLQADVHNENADKNIQNPKTTDAADDEETIEKIAEMIASSSNGSNENSSPKTKKQLQILMSRSHTDPNCNNSSLEISSINEHDKVQIKNRQNQVNVIATNDIYKEKPSEITNETSLLINTKLVSESVISPPSLKSVPDNKQPIENIKTPDKIRFEEVENKLEEMFAGIEDEQLMHPTHTKSNSHINTDKIENDFELETLKSSDILENVKTGDNIRECYKIEALLPKNSSLPTKAAKKSTDSFMSNTNRNKLPPPEDKTDTEAKKYLKSMPPRRRLSVGIDPSLLRISFESPAEIKQKPKDIADKNVLNENSVGKKSNHLPKSGKNKTNRSKNGGGNYKKRDDNLKSSNNNLKKQVVKTETYKSVTKQKQQQKLKHALTLDNDNDLQTRDLENKIRSPFILVKHNGAITVVNATSSDDYNEKNTKAKKTGTYVHERKNVRGCHSSTLSNRYDADTADSTWICVFCKCGPHKKGLGDLFGPYIISLDCEDYRSAVDMSNQDSTSVLNKRRRTDLTLLTDSVASSGKSTWPLKCPNEPGIQAHLSDTQNVVGAVDDTSFNMFSLGMSRISDSSFEIWIHEDCAIWAPNLFVIGSRLVGLEAAIWNSTRHKCVFCLKPGAMICCLQRDCKITAHVPCARESNWSLDELTFWTHCNKHVSKASRKD